MKKVVTALMVGILSALLVVPGCASEFVEPEFYDWNIKCEDLGFGGDSFKIQSPPDFPWPGTHSVDGVGSITIEMVNDTHFNFTSTGILINAVIVKGADSYVYNYSGASYGSPVTADTILNPPLNPASGTFPEISHIEFCYVQNGEPTPTPTETPTTTPTETPTTTPTETPTTTPTETPTTTPTETPTTTPTETPTTTPTETPTTVPEFPLFAAPLAVVFGLIMGAAVLSLAKRR